MQELKKLKSVLDEVITGVVLKDTISFLRGFSSADKSKWLAHSSLEEVHKISGVLNTIIVTKSSDTDRKSTNFLYSLVMLLLETASAKGNLNLSFPLRQCFPSISDYLYEKLAKKKANDQILPIVILMRRCVQNNVLKFRMFSEKLLVAIKETALLEGNEKELQKGCLLLLVAVSNSEQAWPFLQSSILDCAFNTKGSKFGKMSTADQKKVSLVTVFFLSLVQKKMSTPGQDCEMAYKNSFGFVANVIHNLFDKCAADRSKEVEIFPFLSTLIQDLLIMYTDPMWPAASLVLRMLVKEMCWILKALEGQSSAKLKMFSVDHLTKVATKQKANDNEFKKQCAALMSLFRQDPISSMMLVLTQYFSQCPTDSYGDPLRAHQVLHANQYPLNSVPTGIAAPKIWNKEEAATATLYLETHAKNYAPFTSYLAFVLKAATSNCKAVKSSAVKNLTQLIQAEPTILNLSSVQKALTDGLDCTTASGRAAVAGILGRFLSQQSDSVPQYVSYFHRLLEDKSCIVRRAAIEAITALFSNIEKFSGMQKLATHVLSLVRDPEYNVQKAVCTFFSSVWCGDSRHIDCLLQISRSPKVIDWISILLTCSKAGTPAVCLSQAPSITSPDKEPIPEALIEAVAENLQGVHRYAAASILRAVSLVYPNALASMVPVFTELLHQIGDTEDILKRSLCITLELLVPFMTAEEELFLSKKLQEILKKDTGFEMQTSTMTAVLRLLTAVSTKDVRRRYIASSLELLKFYKGNDSADNEKVIRRALVFVVYLWKDYSKDKEASRLVTCYLTRPLYNLTILSALCEARRSHVPSSNDPLLTQQIIKLLSDDSDVQLVTMTLNFLQCTLEGYQNMTEKPNIKQLGNETTEAVSHMLQDVLDLVLDNVLNANLIIRKASLPVIFHVIQSGFILMPRLLPHVIAMTADPDRAIHQAARSQLATVSESWDISLSVAPGLRLAFQLAKKIISDSQVVRGVDTAVWISTCHTPFQLVQSASEKLRKMIATVLKEMEHADDGNYAVFLMDQVVYFPYKMVGAVRHVIQELQAIIAISSHAQVAYLCRRGSACMMSMYKVPFKVSAQSSSGSWSKEPAQRSTTIGDYLTAKFLATLLDAAPDDTAVRESSDNDNGDDHSNDTVGNLPLSDMRKKMRSLERSKICNISSVSTHLGDRGDSSFPDIDGGPSVPVTGKSICDNKMHPKTKASRLKQAGKTKSRGKNAQAKTNLRRQTASTLGAAVSSSVKSLPTLRDLRVILTRCDDPTNGVNKSGEFTKENTRKDNVLGEEKADSRTAAIDPEVDKNGPHNLVQVRSICGTAEELKSAAGPCIKDTANYGNSQFRVKSGQPDADIHGKRNFVKFPVQLGDSGTIVPNDHAEDPTEHSTNNDDNPPVRVKLEQSGTTPMQCRDKANVHAENPTVHCKTDNENSPVRVKLEQSSAKPMQFRDKADGHAENPTVHGASNFDNLPVRVKLEPSDATPVQSQDSANDHADASMHCANHGSILKEILTLERPDVSVPKDLSSMDAQSLAHSIKTELDNATNLNHFKQEPHCSTEMAENGSLASTRKPLKKKRRITPNRNKIVLTDSTNADDTMVFLKQCDKQMYRAAASPSTNVKNEHVLGYGYFEAEKTPRKNEVGEITLKRSARGALSTTSPLCYTQVKKEDIACITITDSADESSPSDQKQKSKTISLESAKMTLEYERREEPSAVTKTTQKGDPPKQQEPVCGKSTESECITVTDCDYELPPSYQKVVKLEKVSHTSRNKVLSNSKLTHWQTSESNMVDSRTPHAPVDATTVASTSDDEEEHSSIESNLSFVQGVYIGAAVPKILNAEESEDKTGQNCCENVRADLLTRNQKNISVSTLESMEPKNKKTKRDEYEYTESDRESPAGLKGFLKNNVPKRQGAVSAVDHLLRAEKEKQSFNYKPLRVGLAKVGKKPSGQPTKRVRFSP